MYSYVAEQVYDINISKLFNIIIDVEKYPEFLPWCIAAKIISQDSANIYADLMINFQGITEQYTSKITYEEPYKIESEAIKGPFKILKNIWHLEYIEDNKTKLIFKIDFEFKSKILNHIIGFLFNKAVTKMTQAFTDRAKSLE